MKASDCIVKFLESQNITHVFGYQGGMITHLVDSLSKSAKTKYIQCYHEQSAAIAAEGYALESGNIGVAISTSGPGATNMMTGIADAYFGSIPVLYITGQVNTYEYKYDKKIRQLGFQETDIVSIVRPVTKYAVMVDKPEELESEIKKALTIALSGRKGPVLIDLPMNISRADIKEFDYNFSVVPDYPKMNSELFEEAYNELKNAKRPLVICGNGILQSNLKNVTNIFLSKSKIPYVVSMLGKGTVTEEADNFCGVIGSYGNRCANIILSQADVVLALGARLDLRQTGNVNSEILKKIKFIHVDIDEHELKDSKIQNKLNLHADAGEFLRNFCSRELSISPDWINYCFNTKESYSQEKELERNVNVKAPYEAIGNLRLCIKEPTTFVSDVGQNQVWVAQMLNLKNKDRLYSSGGLAPMGFAIPCAVGAAFANPDKKIICITGDGGFHFALQSLMLISQYHLNVSVYVLNNSSLGMITQFQTLYFDSNMAGTTKKGGYQVPDIKKIAEAYNLSYKDKFDSQSEKETIYEITLPELTVVMPKLEYNKDLNNMIPYLSEEEINSLEYSGGGGYNCRVVYNDTYIFNKTLCASSFVEAA